MYSSYGLYFDVALSKDRGPCLTGQIRLGIGKHIAWVPVELSRVTRVIFVFGSLQTHLRSVYQINKRSLNV